MNTHNNELNNINDNFPSTIVLFMPYSNDLDDIRNHNYFTQKEIEKNPTIINLERNDLIGLYGCNVLKCNCDKEEKTGYCRLFEYKKWREFIDLKYTKNIVIVI